MDLSKEKKLRKRFNINKVPKILIWNGMRYSKREDE